MTEIYRQSLAADELAKLKVYIKQLETERRNNKAKIRALEAELAVLRSQFKDAPETYQSIWPTKEGKN